MSSPGDNSHRKTRNTSRVVSSLSKLYTKSMSGFLLKSRILCVIIYPGLLGLQGVAVLQPLAVCRCLG